MSIFSGANSSKIIGQRDNLSSYTGEHALEIIQLTARTQRIGRAGIFGMKFKVIASDNDKLRPDQIVEHAFFENKYREYFDSDIKLFLAAASGKSVSDLEAEGINWEKEMEESVSDKQPYAGKVVISRHVGFTKAKATGKEYGKVMFIPAK